MPSETSAATSLAVVRSPGRHSGHMSPGHEKSEDVVLLDRHQVRKQLPDIMGSVLARIWIDPDFHAEFMKDPRDALKANGVLLPNTIHIEFSVSHGERPKVVVYEQQQNSRFKLRLFYLQLIMLAGR